MVVKMMKWRPWPPISSRKFEVKLVVKKMEGGDCDPVLADPEKDHCRVVKIKWKGPKITLGSLRRSSKTDFTKEGKVGDPNGVVFWDQEFHAICTLSGYKENDFLPWEIGFTVINGSKAGVKNKVNLLGKAFLNLAEFASFPDEEEFELNIPLTGSSGVTDRHPSLHISLRLTELRAIELAESPPPQAQSQTSETSSGEKDELSAFKAGLRKVKILKEYVSIKRGKKPSHEHDHPEIRSDEDDCTYRFDSDSFDESDESHEGKPENATIRKSISYGSLAYANCAGGSLFEDDLYYSNHKSDEGCSPEDDPTAIVSEPTVIPNPRRSILPWKKRKLNFKSPKGEPLLNKAYGEEGGDDIDFDRRQLSSDESLIGNWERRDIISRDGCMKLLTDVFFASIDQRSEQAAGEGGCTALVVVIADWFQNNHGLMPIKSQFDSLIREGSSEWRRLCDSETYMARFPDKHFDLETVLEANVRPLSVIPEKSFVSFFRPIDDDGGFEFLNGAMSFDDMWDEISRESEFCNYGESLVYVVSWNDHFFVLKLDSDAYYVIDSLGERLFEGCNQAYILKFDRDSVIFRLPEQAAENGGGEKSTEENEIICDGKECCKEYIKSFLAAIPIREVQADIKKGLVSSTLLHQRLQIEVHYTGLQPRAAPDGDSTSASVTEVAAT